MRTVYYTGFNDGVVYDARSLRGSQMLANFDVLSTDFGITPRRQSESGDSSSTTNQIQNFCVAYNTSLAAYMLYGLGVQSGTAYAEIFYKYLDSTVGGITDATWLTPSNNTSAAAGATSFNLFVYYAATGLIYGAKGGSSIWAFNTAGGAFADTSHSLTYTAIGQGIVHSKDDILYIPYADSSGNWKIASNNVGSWNDSALLLPKGYTVTSLCEFGNYLSIACAPKTGRGNSRVFQWDRNASIATLSESINWDYGNIQVLEELYGNLVGISSSNDSTRNNYRLTVRSWSQGMTGAVKQQEYIMPTTVGSNFLFKSKQKIDNRVYFLAAMYLNGSTYQGIWSVGRNGNRYSVFFEYAANNDTVSTSATPLNAFALIGDYAFISYQDSSGNVQMSKTNDNASYTNLTAVWESNINPGIDDLDRMLQKELFAIGVVTEPLTSGQQIVVKYRVDGGAYSSAILTAAADGLTVRETPWNAGVPFTSGREYEFRIESTGGAVVVGLVYKYDVIETLLS